MTARFPFSITAILSIMSLMLISVLGLNKPANAEDAISPSPALWKLTDEDSDVYLFGTVHILNPELKWRSAKVDEAFNTSETIIFEAPADPAAARSLITKYGLNPSGVKLSSMLSPTANLQLAKTLESFGMKGMAGNFEPLRPWLVGLSLSAIQIQAMGGDPDAGVERILSAEAVRAGKTIGYFETDEQQMQFLSGLSPETEIFFLEDGLRQIKDSPEQIQKLLNTWRIGDIDAMSEIVMAGYGEQEESDEIMEAILTRRNFNWASQIEDLMRGSGTAFIAVGAAHLVGQQSVQVYLSQKGISAVRQ